jgi:hypothetical protein
MLHFFLNGKNMTENLKERRRPVQKIEARKKNSGGGHKIR